MRIPHSVASTLSRRGTDGLESVRTLMVKSVEDRLESDCSRARHILMWSLPHAGNHLLQLRQPAMKKMTATREHDDRQFLWARPREYVGKWNDVVLLAVDDDAVTRYNVHRETIYRRPDQHHSLACDRLGNTGLHVGTERKPGEHDRQLIRPTTRLLF